MMCMVAQGICVFAEQLPKRPAITVPHRPVLRRPLPKPVERDREEMDAPLRREEWFRAGRQSQPGQTAAEARYRAVRSKQIIELAARGSVRGRGHSQLPAVPWQELGPRPQVSGSYGYVAGRVTSIAVDLNKDSSGNTVYVGTAFGGLWKSTNGLSIAPNFVPLTESAPTLAVGSIALDTHTTPTTIYIGTGEPNASQDSYYGIGIMRSTDGGQSWSVATTADFGAESFYGLSFSKLIVDAVFPGNVIACTRSSGVTTFRNLKQGIYRSSDSGQTWILVRTSPYGCSDMVYQASTNTYFAAVRGQGIIKSTDAGINWTPTHTPIVSGAAGSINNLQRIALATRNSELWSVMVDANGNPSTPVPCPSPGPCDTGLSLSNDGGDTWAALPVPPAVFGSNSQGWYDVYFATPGNSGAVVLGGIDLWSALYDGSSNLTWTNLTQSYTGGSVHPDQHAFAAVNAGIWYMGNDGGAWTTQSSGSQWNNSNGSIGAIQFTSVSADAQIAGQFVGGSQDNGTAVGNSSGSQWNTVYGGDGGYTLASKQFPSRYLTENFLVSLHRSDDRGNSFSSVVDSQTIPDYSAFYTPLVFSAADENTVLLGTCRVWRGPANAVNGAGWSPASPDISNTGNCSGYINAIAVEAGTPDIVYAVTNNGNVWQTQNATASSPAWTNITFPPLPQRPLSAVAVAPNDATNVFVAAQGFDTGHIYRRVNGTWIDISGNLPNVPANSIVIDPQTPQNIYLATDAGVYVTTDGGTPHSTWQLLGAGLPNTAVLEIKIAPTSPRTLIAATHGRGAWSISLDGSGALPPPSLTSPANFSTVASNNIHFAWLPVTGAISYRFMLATDPNALPIDPAATLCNLCLISDTTTTTTYPTGFHFVPGTTYYWEVRAVGQGNATSGEWSIKNSFTVTFGQDRLVLNPTIMTFGNVGLFAKSTQTIVLQNQGTSAANITSVSTADPFQFTVTTDCPQLLAAGPRVICSLPSLPRCLAFKRRNSTSWMLQIVQPYRPWCLATACMV